MRWPWQKAKGEEPAHLRAGCWGEEWAARVLKEKGYKILGQRVRMGRRDELDIVARQKDTLVFVEVKTRKSEDFGSPASAVNRAKRHTLSRAAIRYLGKIRKKPDYVRFDVVEVVGEEGEGIPVIRHIENAFTMDSIYRIRW
ncbi:MAG: hypothetical protein A2X46_04730 [Lentisphaerae bacterium GWF2_57_35]|nr:MAG: hypothetical protein A2X46_04730 [Lentisphaerae bacterium GWF2_57_35]